MIRLFKNSLLIIVSLLIFTAISVAKSDYETAKELFNKSINTDDDKLKMEYRKEIIKLAPDTDIGLFAKAYILSVEQPKKLDEIIEIYTLSIKLNSSYNVAFTNRGSAYYNKGEYDKAITDFNEAIDLDPKSLLAFVNRGLAYHYKKEYDKAINDYTKAIELNPKDAEIFYNRGLAYGSKGEYNKAIDDFNKSIDLDPKSLLAFLNRGIVYDTKKEYDKAISDYTKAIELNPKSKEAFCYRGLIHGKKKEYNKAIDDLNKAIELDSQYAEAFCLRGGIYGEIYEKNKAIGDLNKEVEDLNKAIELNPKNSYAFYLRGRSYHIKEDYSRAISDYTKAIELNPDDVSAFYNRGLIYYKQQKYDKAINDFNKAIELNPQYDRAFCYRGKAYYEKRNFERAINDYNKAIELGYKSDEVYYGRANYYREKGEYDKAIDDFNKAIELNPKYPLGFNNRGVSYHKKGEYDKAINDYTRAVELDPKDAGIYFNRGLAYYSKKEYDKAMGDFRKAIDLNSMFIFQYRELYKIDSNNLKPIGDMGARDFVYGDSNLSQENLSPSENKKHVFIVYGEKDYSDISFVFSPVCKITELEDMKIESKYSGGFDAADQYINEIENLALKKKANLARVININENEKTKKASSVAIKLFRIEYKDMMVPVEMLKNYAKKSREDLEIIKKNDNYILKCEILDNSEIIEKFAMVELEARKKYGLYSTRVYDFENIYMEKLANDKVLLQKILDDIVKARKDIINANQKEFSTFCEMYREINKNEFKINESKITPFIINAKNISKEELTKRNYRRLQVAIVNYTFGPNGEGLHDPSKRIPYPTDINQIVPRNIDRILPEWITGSNKVVSKFDGTGGWCYNPKQPGLLLKLNLEGKDSEGNPYADYWKFNDKLPKLDK